MEKLNLVNVYKKLNLFPKSGDGIEYRGPAITHTILDAHDGYVKIGGVWRRIEYYDIPVAKLYRDGKEIYSGDGVLAAYDNLTHQLLLFKDGVLGCTGFVAKAINRLIDEKIKEYDERNIL